MNCFCFLELLKYLGKQEPVFSTFIQSGRGSLRYTATTIVSFSGFSLCLLGVLHKFLYENKMGNCWIAQHLQSNWGRLHKARYVESIFT